MNLICNLIKIILTVKNFSLFSDFLFPFFLNSLLQQAAQKKELDIQTKSERDI
jgi:hypothetical protein